MRISKDVREAILKRVQSGFPVTVDEIAKMLDGADADVARLVANEKNRTVRRMLATLRDENNARTCLATCGKDHAYVNVERCDSYERLGLIEKQLRAKRNGINRSLGKVAQTMKAFGKCVSIHGVHSNEATAMAEKLYAMADELQALLAM